MLTNHAFGHEADGTLDLPSKPHLVILTQKTKLYVEYLYSEVSSVVHVKLRLGVWKA